MSTNAVTANGLSKQDTKYLAAIDECLKEMAAIRGQMKQTDIEIRQLRASSRRTLNETWAILRRVEATL